MKYVSFFSFVLISCQLMAQTVVYRVFFSNKPEAELPFPAIQHISERTWQDMPVSAAYLDSLRGRGANIIGTSKWLNLAYVEADAIGIAALRSFPFVKSISEVRVKSEPKQQTLDPPPVPYTSVDYGQAYTQLSMIGVERLHQLGYTGKGVTIALFDAGYYKVNTFHFFNKLWKNNQIIASRDFHDAINDVYDDDSHGTSVLSVISADSPGVFVGAAFDANFLLARTEVSYFEKHIEELYYLKAVEWADSIGTDIIHASLGYSRFDSPETNYAYSEMDGATTIVTRAAEIAASRGIIVTNSAGNEGQGSWFRITAPCDGDSVLCVGAVDINRFIAPFSSRGPSYDRRIKPEVCAMGLGVVVVNDKDSLRTAGGTSFSAPLIAGMAACLKQAYPARSNMEIINAIVQSADRFTHPDSVYGYGIPDAVKAYLILEKVDREARDMVKKYVSVVPNPASNTADLYLPFVQEPSEVKIYTTEGRLVYSASLQAGVPHLYLDINDWMAGLYFISAESEGKQVHGKLVKR